jgi:NTP pyrophosphatase (non-canonical NTP hydrolase)
MADKINQLNRGDVGYFADYLKTYSGGSLDLYQETATKSAIYPGQGTSLGLMYVALKLNGEAGELAEHVGKAMRDDGLTVPIGFGNGVEFEMLTEARRALIIKEVGDVLWYLSAACNELGISLSKAALTNLQKLADRSERDALRGSGDER